MTREDFQREWAYVLDERRGMLAGADKLTPEQEELAQREAREHMDELEKLENEIKP